jgi:hypothetical protein
MQPSSADAQPRAWLRSVVWSGALALVLSGVLQAVFPQRMGPLPKGMRTPVLALELARTPSEIEAMFGPAGSERRARRAAQADRGNVIDYAFIPVYCFFLFACARAFAAGRPRVAPAVLALSVLAGLGDAVENVFLFRITARLGGELAGDMTGLIAATWVKWLSLVGCLALLSPSLRGRGTWGRVTSFLCLAALPLALLAAVLRGVVAELMLLVITLAIIALWIEALRARRGA